MNGSGDIGTKKNDSDYAPFFAYRLNSITLGHECSNDLTKLIINFARAQGLAVFKMNFDDMGFYIRGELPLQGES